MTKKNSSAASSPSTTLDNGIGAASSGRFICSMCSKVYRSGAGLRYHKRKRHRGMVEPTALHRVKCQEPGCTYQMLAISDLRNHLSNHHQKPEYKCTEEKKFLSIADFTDWKASFETRTGSKYVKNCGAKGKSDNQTTEYYYCNRTGPYKSVGQGLRRSKAQGSLRCGIHCTSSMKVEIQSDEHITVQYYPAHYGHSNLPATDEAQLPDGNLTLGGSGGASSSSSPAIINGHHHHHQQQQQQQQQQRHHLQDNTQNLLSHYPSHGAGDCSSSSSGSASTSPSGGSNSNSNSNHPSIVPASERSLSSLLSSTNSHTTNNIHSNMVQNQMSHCIIISPSFMVEDGSLSHSNHQHHQHHHHHPHSHHQTPVLVVQQHQSVPQTPLYHHAHQQQQQQPLTYPLESTNLSIKKEKSVSDIMHETFQLLSYWPLEHHQALMSVENEQQPSFHHVHLNMDEHLMF